MNSIPQNLRNVLKNRIKILINPILYNLIDFTVDNLFVENAENMYFSLFYNIQSSTRKLIGNGWKWRRFCFPYNYLKQALLPQKELI